MNAAFVPAYEHPFEFVYGMGLHVSRLKAAESRAVARAIREELRRWRPRDSAS